MESERNDSRRANVLDPTRKVNGSEPKRNGGKETDRKGLYLTARLYLGPYLSFPGDVWYAN